MTPAVITLAFDPLVTVGDVTIRLQTIALAVIVLLALLLTLVLAARWSRDRGIEPGHGPRPADLPFLLLGAVPGAVVGGRLDYVLVHLDAYAASPSAILNPAQGALGLGLAIPGAMLGAAVLAKLIDAPLGPWFRAATIPMLLALAAGKAAGVLIAEGQGAPADLPWATAYSGSGPWASLAPTLPSHPSQVYEALLVAIVIVVLVGARRTAPFRTPGSAAGLVARSDRWFVAAAIVGWAAARLLAAFTWRDAAVVGPLNAEQLIVLGLALGVIAGAFWQARAARGVLG